MAFWALCLLVVSIFGLLVSVAGVLLLLRSLQLGRDANMAALKAVDSSKDSNDILRAEQRPWLSVSINSIAAYRFSSSLNDENQKSTCFSLDVPVTITNSGKTTAHNVAIEVEAFGVGEALHMARHAEKGGVVGFTQGRGAIAPNSAMTGLHVAHLAVRPDCVEYGQVFVCCLVVSASYSAQPDGKREFTTCQVFNLGVEGATSYSQNLSARILHEGKPTIIAYSMNGYMH